MEICGSAPQRAIHPMLNGNLWERAPARDSSFAAKAAPTIGWRNVGAALAANCPQMPVNTLASTIYDQPMSTCHYHSSNLRKHRFVQSGQTYLVSASTRGRYPLFDRIELGQLVADEIRLADDNNLTNTTAFVVMPDHFHWLFQLQPGHSLASVVKRVKGRSAYRINRIINQSGPVWQAGYHDRNVRSEDSLEALGNYVIANPVRGRLVAEVDDYPLWDLMWRRWSSSIRG
jgi:putative transposase